MPDGAKIIVHLLGGCFGPEWYVAYTDMDSRTLDEVTSFVDGSFLQATVRALVRFTLGIGSSVSSPAFSSTAKCQGTALRVPRRTTSRQSRKIECSLAA